MNSLLGVKSLTSILKERRENFPNNFDADRSGVDQGHFWSLKTVKIKKS